MTTIPAGSPHYRAAVENRFAGDARFTEATLAVAYEMRTANLITFLSWQPTGNPSDAELQTMIVERLGLVPTKGGQC